MNVFEFIDAEKAQYPIGLRVMASAFSAALTSLADAEPNEPVATGDGATRDGAPILQPRMELIDSDPVRVRRCGWSARLRLGGHSLHRSS